MAGRISETADFGLVLEEPPAPARTIDGRSVNEGTLAVVENLKALMEQPGVSGRIATYAGKSSAIKLASELRKNKPSRQRPPGKWEFRIARLTDGRQGVYARYLGPPDEPESTSKEESAHEDHRLLHEVPASPTGASDQATNPRRPDGSV